MKQLKWEIQPISEQLLAAAADNEHSLNRSRYRMAVLQFKIKDIYDAWTGEEPAEKLALHVITLGQLMIDYGHPTLIASNVPFHIRRQLYENHSELGDIIHYALNSDDYYFNIWSKQRGSAQSSTKASIARSLWSWYYGVFEPVATRFVAVGSEHFMNHLR